MGCYPDLHMHRTSIHCEQTHSLGLVSTTTTATPTTTASTHRLLHTTTIQNMPQTSTILYFSILLHCIVQWVLQVKDSGNQHTIKPHADGNITCKTHCPAQWLSINAIYAFKFIDNRKWWIIIMQNPIMSLFFWLLDMYVYVTVSSAPRYGWHQVEFHLWLWEQLCGSDRSIRSWENRSSDAAWGN
jgi:hypothetical protein